MDNARILMYDEKVMSELEHRPTGNKICIHVCRRRCTVAVGPADMRASTADSLHKLLSSQVLCSTSASTAVPWPSRTSRPSGPEDPWSMQSPRSHRVAWSRQNVLHLWRCTSIIIAYFVRRIKDKRNEQPIRPIPKHIMQNLVAVGLIDFARWVYR